MKSVTVFTVAHLIDSHEAHLGAEVRRGKIAPTTLDWYRYQYRHLRRAAGSEPAADLRYELLAGRVPVTYHFGRAIKALYAWAADEDVGLVPKNPFRKLKVPPVGQRERVLSRSELARLYAAAPRRLRPYLLLLRRTMARPAELRLLRWRDVHLGERVILLTEFKGKRLRRDRVTVRRIPIDLVVLRLLRGWKRRRVVQPDDFVFPASPGRPDRPRSYGSLRKMMRGARRSAGLNLLGERVVFYTLRHTAATMATRNGIRDRLLADMLGHTTTVTTARYQHLDAKDLVEAIDRATARPALRLLAG